MLPMTPGDKATGEHPVREVQTSSYWRASSSESWTWGSGKGSFAPCHGVIEWYSQNTRGSYRVTP
jgi:hypothetical protein